MTPSASGRPGMALIRPVDSWTSPNAMKYIACFSEKVGKTLSFRLCGVNAG